MSNLRCREKLAIVLKALGYNLRARAKGRTCEDRPRNGPTG